MALFKISKGKSSNLSKQDSTEGFCWFTPEDGKFYVDIKTGSPSKIGNSSDTEDVTRVCLSAAMADQLRNARLIGNASFNGTANISFKQIGFIDSLYSGNTTSSKETDGYPAIYFNSANNRDTYLRAPQPLNNSLNTDSGFLPVQKGNIGNGTSSLGKSDFYFAKSYVDNSYVKQVNFNDGAASLQYDSTNKCINFVFA